MHRLNRHLVNSLRNLPNWTENNTKIRVISCSQIRMFSITSYTPREQDVKAAQEPAEGEKNFENLSSILQTIENDKEVFVSKAASVLIAIANLKKENKVEHADYMQDEQFLKVLKSLESEKTKKIDTLAVVSCLKGMEELGMSNESFSVKNLENTLTWTARTCSIRDLVMLLSFCMARRKTESQEILFSEVCKSLERRWMEIKGGSPLIVQAPSDTFWILLNKNHLNNLVKSGKDEEESSRPMLLKDVTDGWMFAGLLHYSEEFSSQFLVKLEDRIADVVEEMSPGDLTLILIELGRKRRRSIPLIKALTFYLTKHRNLLDIKQLSDSLFALNQLSFKDQATLERICSEIENQISSDSKSVVLRSIMTSLGQLKYPSPGVVARILDWYETHMDDPAILTTKDMTSLLVTLAHLNYKSSNNEKLMKHITQSLKPELFKDSPRRDIVWLDVVWSLVLLGRASNDHFESVLSPNFHNSLIYGDSKNLGGTLKLLNINAAATKLYKDYKGPTINISEDALLRDIKVSPSLHKVQFCQIVMEAFASLFPPPRLMTTNVNTLMGFVADGEFVCETSTAKPLSVQELSNKFESCKSIKLLPPTACRVALVAASFQDCLINGEISGVTAHNIKLMESVGYKVFLVKYSDVQSNMKLVARVRKLDAMLKQLLEIEDKSDTSSSPVPQPQL